MNSTNNSMNKRPICETCFNPSRNILAVSDFALVIALNYAVIIQVKNGH